MTKILEINDLKKLAKKKLPKMFYDYIDTGSYSGVTYTRNEEDFNKIKWKTGVDENGITIDTLINPHPEITWPLVKAEMDKL